MIPTDKMLTPPKKIIRNKARKMSDAVKNLDTKKAQLLALQVGGAGLALFVVSLLLKGWRDQAMQSYLLAFSLVVSIPLGSLFLLMLQNVTGGRWGLSIRRLLEAAVSTFPYTAILLIPIFIGLPTLYEWATPEALNDSLIMKKAAYLNKSGFILRSLAFFAIWSFIANRLLTWSRAEDCGDMTVIEKMGRFSAPGIVIYALTMTFGAFDWLMSIEPHWFSTMFGVRYGAGAALGSLAVAVIVLNKLKNVEPIKSVMGTRLFWDLGNLMLAFTMFWAYVSFSEFLIIWSANLPEERFWYSDRLKGGWQYLSIAVLALHFFAPFFLLINRSIKKNIGRLAKVAVFILIMRFLDLLWTVAPSYQGEGADAGFSIHLLDVTTAIGMAGMWAFFFLKGLSSRPLLASNNPRIKDCLVSHGDAHHG